jgi:signal transduction histidine kinase
MQSSAGRRRLLVVEDDGDLRESLAEALREAGFEVSEASDGSEALAKLRKTAADAVLLDLMMPGMDGWDFRAAQKRDPSIAKTPVVVLSADGSSRAQAVDAALFLKKPSSLAELLSGIEGVLSQAERQRLANHLAHTDRLASLGTLAAGIAHEINNPLTIVLGKLLQAEAWLAPLEGETTVKNARQCLDDARQCAERIQRIVRDVGSFARYKDPLSPIDVRRALEGVVNMMHGELRQHAQLVHDHQPVPPVTANEGQLSQIFVNLLLNAVHAVSGEDGAAEIRTRSYTSGDGDAVIEVSDTGCGIPQALQTAVFNPFFTTKPPGQGTGLGLSISAGIVSQLGGRIELESQVGCGSTFRVLLPARTG